MTSLAYRRQQPRNRVYWALERISRDRILSPQEVREIGMRLARCASANPSHTFNAAAGSAQWTGMLRGRSLPPGVQHLFERTFRKPFGLERALLDLVLKEKQQWQFQARV